jgi:hypothetical protein
MKLWIQHSPHSDEEGPRLDFDVLSRNGIEIVKKPHLADFGVIFYVYDEIRHTVHLPLPKGKVLAIYDEPPLLQYKIDYQLRHHYHSFFTFSSVVGPNVFRLTDDPPVFPYYPQTRSDVVRKNTRLKTRGVFFRGSLWHGDGPILNEFGSRCLYTVRRSLVNDLSRLRVHMDIAGRVGWEKSTHHRGIWPQVKRFELSRTQADFCLCSENSMLDDYITEKIHHAMNADLVALYLGSPKVEEHIPPGAFINLNRYFDPATGRVDAEAVRDRLATITQDEYDHILHTARSWRRNDMLEERAVEARQRLTRKLIARLRGDQAGAPASFPTLLG